MYISLSAVESMRKDDLSVMVPPEVKNSIEFPGMPPHKLQLKHGEQIMLLRNLDTQVGHCNGTRYTILDISNRLIKVKISSGPKVGISTMCYWMWKIEHVGSKMKCINKRWLEIIR
ncbi:MAG: hypothetical protein MHMPM18_005164 [Marteilia pararefringens]